MQLPLELVFRNVERTGWLEELVRTQAERLHRFAGDIIACRVAIEQLAQRHQTGNPFRVRIDVTLAPKKELVVHKEAFDQKTGLSAVLLDAFETMARRLDEFADLRRYDIKTHVDTLAVVTKLFHEDGYGFLEADDGREIYFHSHSVLHGWDRLTLGTAVRYTFEMGDKGPQASSVQIVDKPGLNPQTGQRAA
jgi:cold shock CspA family protein